MVGAVDRMLAASKSGIQLSAQQQAEIFGHDWRPEHVETAEQRWGQTTQWAQYSQRAAALSAADWQKVAAETLWRRTWPQPSVAEANALAERHRVLMSTYFDGTHAMQVCMGRVFAEDCGFAAYYDKRASGLAQWLQQVLFANAQANGIDPLTATWQ